jgi:hypothetical protein
MRAPRLLLLCLLALVGIVVLGSACGGTAFDSQSKVNSVRLFGVRADKPYAEPGETVTLEVLATDARESKPLPLTVYWIPIVCINPRQDLYYLCFLPSELPDGGAIDGGSRLVSPFPPDAGADEADAGAARGAGGALSSIPVGVDLSSMLPKGNTFSFRMPDDVIQPRPGSAPYGLAIVFNVACAGQVRLAARVDGRPQQVPIQCTDQDGVPLSPNDYVIGINRVYSYADRANTNPVIEKVTVDGVDVDPAMGVTVDRCVASRRAACKPTKLDVRVSSASWEPNPNPDGTETQHEQIWVAYYSDIGDLKDEARLLFDAKKGRIDDSAVEYRAPYAAGEGTLWAVVHDNRAGAAFVTLPLHVR